MYTHYSKAPTNRYRINTVKSWNFASDVNDKTAIELYDNRMLLLEILDISVDMCCYLLVTSLRATIKIDKHFILTGNDSLLDYGNAAMQEMLVIRIREIFYAKKDDLYSFELRGFYQAVYDRGVQYPKPNRETNNAIFRIIHRRNSYSAHHGDGKKDHSLEQNRLHSNDLATAMLYISKIEEDLFETKDFDPFEVLLNDRLGRDSPLVWDNVYQTLTGQPPYIAGEDNDKNTPEFETYLQNAQQELKKMRANIQRILDR